MIIEVNLNFLEFVVCFINCLQLMFDVFVKNIMISFLNKVLIVNIKKLFVGSRLFVCYKQYRNVKICEEKYID